MFFGAKGRNEMTAKAKKQIRSNRSKPGTTPEKRSVPVVGIVFGGVALLLVAAIVLSSDETIGSGGEYGEPVITGDVVAPLGSSSVSADPALGVLAPEVTGVDFDDSVVEIVHDGTPKAIVFLAHWCHFCQAEVPEVQQWLNATGGVDGLEMLAVSTSAGSGQPNWPPSKWLDRENWSVPTIRDNSDSSVLQSYGGTAFPYWVFLNGDGTVAFRQSGRIPIANLQGILETLVADQP